MGLLSMSVGTMIPGACETASVSVVSMDSVLVMISVDVVVEEQGPWSMESRYHARRSGRRRSVRSVEDATGDRHNLTQTGN